MPFTIIQNDITKVAADAIVNTANPAPRYGRGTDEAIYSAAGREKLLAARGKIGRLKPGETAVTEAFDLPAKYIIHTVGPKWQGGDQWEEETLASCYRKSLQMAKILECESVAFPLISAGSYRFPKDRALQIALGEIREFLSDEENDMDVTLVVYDRGIYELSMEIAGEVKEFLRERTTEVSELYEDRRKNLACEMTYGAPMMEDAALAPAPGPGGGLEDIFDDIGDTFQQRLLKLIDERGLTDPQVYKKANLDRKLFSKIRSNPNYHPSKKTALALAIALELDMTETADLLARGELAMSPGSKFDLIIEYCIRQKIYDIFEINAILFDYEQPLLV
ncbi:MAG: macro domain-containing protein [Firmicutes bacterium]|nr:macro domain-containing protein [Bacillota bacterium]